jgi:subtilisin family serine protease
MRGFFNRKNLLAVGFLAASIVVAGFIFRPAPVGAQSFQTYVLTANQWGAEQDAAVATAGGIVSFSHGKTGIGVVTSPYPDFLSRALATKAFRTGAQDMIVQWQPPVPEGGLIEAAVTPGDETFVNLQWNIKAVEAEGAWAAGFTGYGARVAVVDGGIYTAHIDLAGQVDIAASRSFVPGYAFNEDVGTFWHATHVAGIIAAKDNAIGTIGIAPDATIIGVKVLHNGSGAFSSVILGILYASTPIAEGGAGADIINMSLRGIFPKAGGAGPLVAALNKAVNYAGQNTLVVSAAGNDYLDLDHSGSITVVPAESGNGIAVSATGPVGFAVGYPDGATNFRRPASYTNYGNSVIWLAAPGGDNVFPGNDLCTIPRVPSGVVTTACWVFDMVISCSRGSGSSTTSYTWADGTSMAAPAVAAVAALAKQRYPGISVGDLKTLLARTADDEGKTGHDPYYGRGFVNARRAVTE